MIYFNKFLGVLGIVFIECLISALGLNHDEFLAQLKVPQCQQDCLSKVSFDFVSFYFIAISITFDVYFLAKIIDYLDEILVF